MQDTKTPEKLSPDEVAQISETLREQEEILENADGLGSEYIQDKNNLRKSVLKNRRILERDAALLPKTAGERKKIEDEIRRLTEMIIKDMPTRREMNSALGTPEAERAIRRNRIFHAKHNNALLRLKHLKRCVDPDDPFAGDLERIRPD